MKYINIQHDKGLRYFLLLKVISKFQSKIHFGLILTCLNVFKGFMLIL